MKSIDTNSAALLSLYGLKWNPFLPGAPTEGLYHPATVDSFGRRCEAYVRDGGFALVTGAPGLGKSITLRLLDERLSRLRDVIVRPITRPQSGLSDFYRELGDLFGVPLTPRNRWGGFKAIREAWQSHIDATLVRPVITIDEAQEMPPAVLSDLRLLSSRDYDSRTLLFVILAGDARLDEKLRSEDLLPLKSRVRTHLHLEPQSPADLALCLRHAMATSGNAQLMTAPVVTALCEHAGGNCRTLMSMAADLLVTAADRDARQIDEKLFFELFALPSASGQASPKAKRR